MAAPSAATLDTGAALTLALGTEPANWNELSTAGTAGDPGLMTGAVLPSAFVVQPDYTLALNQTFLLSATATRTVPPTVVYRINPKATWSDGVPITWADFQYNWEAQSGQARFTDTGGRPFTPASTLGYSEITSVAATDDDPDVVTVVFSSIFPDWRTLFSDLVPAHIATKVGFDTGFTDPVDDVVSGGPFLVEAYVPGRSLTLVRNARWWGTPASLSAVTFDFVARPLVVADALGLGELGGAYLAPSAVLVASLRALPDVKIDLAAGGTWEELEFNQTNRWLKDPVLRQSIFSAVDRPQLIANTVGSYAQGITPLDSRVFLPGEPAYRDTSGGTYDHANVAAATAALARAGYKLAAGGLSRGGQQVSLRISASPGALHGNEEQYLTTAIGALGIKVTVVAGMPVPGSHAYDLAIVDRSTSPALAAADAAVGDPATVGTSNYSGADTPAVDALLATAGATTDPTTRAQLYNEADVDLWHSAESLPLFQLPTLLVYQQKYVGIVDNPSPAGPTWNLANWGVAASS
ncbi:MAG TPA: ABC transporter substrate-binding protein [Acidimicrobiales bacterium]|nr:ABC transporter substrate-binding protein [Acidimicrobiales bacterium]